MQRRFFAWALLGMLLSGCGGTPYDDQNPAVDKRSMPPPVPGETWAARAPMDFTFKGKQANAGPDWPRQIRPSEMFSNGTKLAKALRLYSNFELTEKPGKRIGDIRSAASRPAALKGLGGLYGESLLDAADSSLTGGGHFNSAKRTTMLISGQIAHYEYNPCPAPNTGNGLSLIHI